MNEYQETYEKEISLMDLMFYCLKKWRWIVASMLILAVLAGGYKYQATVKGNVLKKEAEALGDDKRPVPSQQSCQCIPSWFPASAAYCLQPTGHIPHWDW